MRRPGVPAATLSAALRLACALVLIAAPACRGQVELPTQCEPHERELCYTGPPGTEGVGPCRPGLRACADDGSGFGPCEGEVLPGVEDCAAPGDEDCDGEPGVCTGDTLWAKRFTGSDYQYADGLAVAPSGDLAVNVRFSGDLSIGPPVGVLSSDNPNAAGCVLGLSSAGDPRFATVADGSPLDGLVSDAAGNTAGALVFQHPVTLDGQTFTPAGTQSALLFKLGPSGAFSFVRQIDAIDYLSVDSLGMSSSGDLVIAGSAVGPVDLGSGPMGGEDGLTFVARLDPSGKTLFSNAYSSSQVRSTFIDPQGNIVLAGYFFDTVNFGGETLVTQGQEDAFVVKLGPSGEHLWSKRFGSSGVNHSHWLTIALDGQGNIYLFGDYSDTWDFGGGPVTAVGESDIYLVKLDPDGGYLWGRYFGNGQLQYGQSITVDPAGAPVFTAQFGGSIDFGAGALQAASPLTTDLAVVKLTPGGDTLWSRRFGQGNTLQERGLGTDGAGHVYLSGRVAGAVDLGTGELPSTGTTDAFVLKLSP